jgi:hypothetical protein
MKRPPRALTTPLMYERSPEEIPAFQKQAAYAKNDADDDSATTVFEEESVTTKAYHDYLKKQGGPTTNLHVVTPPFEDAQL